MSFGLLDAGGQDQEQILALEFREAWRYMAVARFSFEREGEAILAREV